MPGSIWSRGRNKIRSWSTRTAIIMAAVICVALGGGGVYAAIILGGVQSSVNLSNGLVGWWKFDGNATDSSGNGNNGTVFNASLTTDRKGTFNSAYAFTGATNSYINAGTSSTLSFTDNFSLSAWINPTSYHTTGYYGLKNEFLVRGPATTYNYALQASDANTIAFIKRTGAEGLQYNAFGSVPTLTNKWTLVTVTVKSGTVSLYINGSFLASQAVGTIGPGASDTLYFGGQGGGNSEQPFTGSLDDIRIYNRAINATEARALYTEHASVVNAASGENGLVGWWKLDGNAKDATPYGRNGTISNAVPTTDRKGTANSAYSFNGTNSSISIPSFNLSNAITVSAWVYPTVSSESAKVVGKHTGSTNCQGTLGITGGKASFEITTGGTYHQMLSTSSLPINTWSLITGVYDGTNGYIYVNAGTPASLAATGTLANNALNWSIGSLYGGSASGAFTGSIDDARIYSRALSAQDISNLYSSYSSQINLQSSPTASQSSGNLNAGLIGYWPFNGNAKDATPYQHNGTLVNAPTLTVDRNNRSSSAYLFAAASSQYIDLGTSTSLTPPSISWSVWVKANSLSSWNGIVSNMSAWGTGFGLEMGTAQNIAATVSGSYLKTSWVPTTGVWYHIVATHDAATNMNVLYVNGNQEATSTAAISYEAGAKTYVGVFYTSPSLYFDGTIDDLRLYNRALSATEAQALYNNYY